MKRFLLIVAMVCLPLLAACGTAPQGAGAAPAGSRTPSGAPASSAPTPTTSQTAEEMPCDPGAGFPSQKRGCPDPEPETGWLTATDGSLSLTPFRTLGNDAEGEAYAQEHGEEYPFPNDHFDAPDGAGHPLEITRDTVCTGIILAGHQEPLADHVVTCGELVGATGGRRLPVAVWYSGEEVVQASELYRP